VLQAINPCKLPSPDATSHTFLGLSSGQALQFGKVGGPLRLVALSAILVGVVGASWSWHLLQWYISANALTACILGTQCPLVFQTSFSYFYGVPIHLLAVAWFSLLTLLAAIRAYGIQSAALAGVVIGALCVPAIIYLDYVQVAVIHAICSDCELAHILGLILFGLFAFIYRADRKNKTRTKSGTPAR
jgi:uncharacterized membrane protein